MSNYIINGDFSSGFNHWDNGVGGGLAYTLDFEKARATSDIVSAAEWVYKMQQTFNLNDEVVTGIITAWGKWQAQSGGIADGTTRFIVTLFKPDSSSVTLLDTTKTADSDEGNLLDGVDIKSNLDQYGNYSLWLEIRVRPAQIAEDPKNIYLRSYGWYDNISIDIAVKKYKTVHEKLGSSGKLNSKAGISRSEAIALVEAFSTESFTPTYYYETASESVALSESYSRTIKRVYGVAEVVGLVEAAQAKRTQGNMETTYMLEDLTQWTETSRVTTPWIKTRVEIA